MRNVKRPNILHIFTDMQRADTISALGNPHIKTPNLDRLCREGTAFTNAYSPSPICIPARCSMILGQYPSKTGCYDNMPMPADKETFMAKLSKAGYRTYGIGKCHFYPEKYSLRGFDSRELQEEGGCSKGELEKNHYLNFLHKKGYDHIHEAYGVRGSMYYIPQLSQVPGKDHPSAWIGDRSCRFIEENSEEKDKPWYLFSSFIHPHPPLAPPNPWHKLYRSSSVPYPLVPENSESLLTFINKVQNRFKHRDQRIDGNLVRLQKAYYYACISFVDYQIGKILECLEKQKILDDTLILFTSDHGEYLGDYNCFGKRSMHDASSKVPLIIRYPKSFKANRIEENPVSLVDIAPTFLDAAEINTENEDFDGKSLFKITNGNCKRNTVYSRLSVQGKIKDKILVQDEDEIKKLNDKEKIAAYSLYMAVSKDWKYFYSAPDNKEFLFDKTNDPGETENKANNDKYLKEKNELKNSLMGHLKKNKADAGIKENEWIEFPSYSVNKDPDSGLLFQDHYTPWADTSLPEEYEK